MIRRVSAAEARRNFTELLNRVQFHRYRVLIKKYRRPVAALVSVDDFRQLQVKESGKAGRP